MADVVPTFCRLAECTSGVLVHREGGRLVDVTPDPESALLCDRVCELCTASLARLDDPRRVRRPRRRQGDRWEEVPWDRALAEIGAGLKAARKAGGPDAVGLHVGAPTALSGAGTVRSLAWPLATGSPQLFTPLNRHGGAWLRAVELVVGHAAPLQGDVTRAHHVILLGANQEAQGWGPLQAGRLQAEGLAHSRKTKGTKLVAADPRRTPLAARADLHLPIRPATELWLVLGMIHNILENGWHDEQYTKDWCNGMDALRAAVAPWTLERCAEVCGVPAADIGGVALKFSRAAMGVAHRSPQALQNEHGTLTAWAILVLHALTANLLRPGGLYENQGLFDARGFARSLATDGAPGVGNFPLFLLQAPDTLLTEQIEGGLRALICVGADPARDLPGGAAREAALRRLELLVVADVAETATTRLAHWVLPLTHAWERGDVRFADTTILPWRSAQVTGALAPAGEAKDEASLLADLFDHYGPALRGSPFGAHLRLLGGRLVKADLEAWMRGKLEGRHFPGLAEVAKLPHGWNGGDVDRATWRISTESGKLELLPAPVAAALAALTEPRLPAGYDRWLLTSAARDGALRAFDRPDGPDPGVGLHPDTGVPEGARVWVRTPAGAVEVVAHLDPGLRPDTVDLPAGYAADVGALVPAAPRDPFVGTAAWDGLPCVIERG